MTAAYEGYVDILRILIEAKVQIEKQDKVYAAHTTTRLILLCTQCIYYYSDSSFIP